MVGTPQCSRAGFCSLSHATSNKEQGSWGALELVGTGDWQCCYIPGAGAAEPRKDEMGGVLSCGQGRERPW